jgi:hypothetical protein
MELGQIIALAVLALGIAGAQSVWPTRNRRIRRALASRPEGRVEGAHGVVRLSGRIRRVGDLLIAPFSGRPCVAYEVVVDEPSRVREHGNQSLPVAAPWRRIVERREAIPFLVADETGEARIDLTGPYELSLTRDFTGDTGKFTQYADKHRALATFLAAIEVEPVEWSSGSRWFRYEEAVLEEGSRVSVSANAELEVDPSVQSAGPRELPRRLVLRGTEEVPLLISDGEGHKS